MMAASKEVNSVAAYSMERFALAIMCSQDQSKVIQGLSDENFDKTVMAYTYCQSNSVPKGLCEYGASYVYSNKQTVGHLG